MPAKLSNVFSVIYSSANELFHIFAGVCFRDNLHLLSTLHPIGFPTQCSPSRRISRSPLSALSVCDARSERMRKERWKEKEGRETEWGGRNEGPRRVGMQGGAEGRMMGREGVRICAGLIYSSKGGRNLMRILPLCIRSSPPDSPPPPTSPTHPTHPPPSLFTN